MLAPSVSRGSSISVVCVARCCSAQFFNGSSLRVDWQGNFPFWFWLSRPAGDRKKHGGAPPRARPTGNMQPRIYWILVCTAVVLAAANAATEKEQQSEKGRTSGSSSYNSFADDIYLEDQDPLEGSGRGAGEGRDDLEASGSGLGPDDEDGRDDHELTSSNRIDTVPNRPAEPKPPYTDEPSAKAKEPPNVQPVNRPDTGADVIKPSVGDEDGADNGEDIHEVYIMNPKHEDRASSFFAQPGVLAAVIGGAVVGLLCAILVVMFIVYRMRKKDEGSYALDEPRRSPAAQAFPKPGAPHHNREFYA